MHGPYSVERVDLWKLTYPSGFEPHHYFDTQGEALKHKSSITVESVERWVVLDADGHRCTIMMDEYSAQAWASETECGDALRLSHEEWMEKAAKDHDMTVADVYNKISED